MLSLLRNQRGMTLFEIIVVLVIVTAVSGLLFKGIGNSLAKAKVNQTKLIISEVAKAVEQYNADCGTYPQSLKDLVNQPSSCSSWGPNPYVKENQLVDAWKSQLQYTNEGSRYTIISLGADKQSGGDGINRDINSNEE